MLRKRQHKYFLRKREKQKIDKVMIRQKRNKNLGQNNLKSSRITVNAARNASVSLEKKMKIGSRNMCHLLVKADTNGRWTDEQTTQKSLLCASLLT